MPGPWDQNDNRGNGHLGELPMGGLLSELLMSEGVDPNEFVEVAPESLASPVLSDCNTEPCQSDLVPPPSPAVDARNTFPNESAVALPGFASQLWALNQVAGADQDIWPEAEPVDLKPLASLPENEPQPFEAHAFALPGLLLSLTEDVAEPGPEPAASATPFWREPVVIESAATAPAASEPVAIESMAAEPQSAELAASESAAIEPAAIEASAIEPATIEPAAIEPEPLVEIVEVLSDDLPYIEVPLTHGRTNDLSNLIGAIDSEIAAAAELPPGRAHELDKTHERFVCFRLGGISYGLHMRLVREVDRIGRVTQVPGAPKLVCGLVNLRGEILPLLDTRLLLELEPSTWPPSGYLVVVQPDPEEQPVALLVDELGGVALVDPGAIVTELADLEYSMAQHTLGMTEHRGRIVLLLDHRNLVTPEALMASAERGSSN